MHSVSASYRTYCRSKEVIQTIYAILLYSLIIHYKVIENDEEILVTKRRVEEVSGYDHTRCHVHSGEA